MFLGRNTVGGVLVNCSRCLEQLR